MRWPRESAEGLHDGDTRPTISLLFSGGVFRGVYQLGVLNALDELGIQPDLIGGCIRRFDHGCNDRAGVLNSTRGGHLRRVQIARIAAAFLGIDRSDSHGPVRQTSCAI